MNASLIESLASLQEIDRRIRDRLQEISQIERQDSEHGSALDEKRRQAEANRSEFAAIATRRRDLEAQHQDGEQRIKDQRMRLGRIRNDKEQAAAQREVELTKESNARLEEELLLVLEQCEALEGTLRAIEAELTQVEAQAAATGQGGEARLNRLREENEADAARREAMAASLQPAIRKRYDHIFQRRGGIAVVEVVQGNCRGCNVNVPPQLYIEIQKRQDVHVCPNCQRMLFWRPPAAEPDELDDAN